MARGNPTSLVRKIVLGRGQAITSPYKVFIGLCMPLSYWTSSHSLKSSLLDCDRDPKCAVRLEQCTLRTLLQPHLHIFLCDHDNLDVGDLTTLLSQRTPAPLALPRYLVRPRYLRFPLDSRSSRCHPGRDPTFQPASTDTADTSN